MVLVFISFGHDAPRGNGRLKISGCVALATFMPSIKKNIDVIVSAPFYDTVHGRNVWCIGGIYGDIVDGPTYRPRTIAIACEERKP